MRKLKITHEIYENNLALSNIWDDDCDCFGIDIDGKFYLYLEENFDKYWLYVFDKTIEKLLISESFVSKLLRFKLENEDENICDFCGFISDCMNGNCNMNERPFELKDIIAANYK